MKMFFRLVVILLCIAWLASLFGCGKKHILDGPDMERLVCEEFTISRCNERYETVYSYTVKLNDRSNEGWLYVNVYDGKNVEKSIRLEANDVDALYGVGVLYLPNADEMIDGSVLGLTATDSHGKTHQKNVSSAKEAEILGILSPYIQSLGLEEPFMLDGPSMEYSPKWVSFSVSRRDSSTLYSFWFTVDEEKMTVIGECQDREGHTYSETEGMTVPQEVIDALHELDLEQLPDEEPWPDDLEMPLDDSSCTLSLTLSDEEIVKKNANGVAIEIYNLLLPYLKNK